MVALLLLIALAGLSSGLLVRELIVRDFRAFMSGRMEDRTYWIMARLEGKFAENGRWEPAALADDIVWAYMMGLAVRVVDGEKRPVMDIRQAMERLSPPMKRRVLAYAKGDIAADFGSAVVHPLFHGGEEIGELEVACTAPNKELVFVDRSNRLLLLSLLAVGSVTLVLSIILSRRITAPLERLTEAAGALHSGETDARVPVEGTREFRTMAETFNRMADALASQESLRKGLLTNAAHELRTPLATMRLQVEAMTEGVLPADHGRLTSLMGELDRLRGIVGALEELSQAEASAMSLRREPVALRKFLEPIVERFACSAPEADFTLDAPHGLFVTADPERLSQVVINLLGNAVKALQGKGTITVRAGREDNVVTLSIEDSGCGISEEDLPLVFERFYRRFAKGMGVGLAIVRELVAAHGGTVTVKSTVGKGTCFTIQMPAETS